MIKPSACLTISNDARHVHLAGTITRAFSEVVGLPALEVARLELAVVEAINNIIEHACSHLSAARISFSIGVENESLVIELRDPGASLPGSPSVVMPEPLAESGRGWPLILAAVDGVEYRVDNGVNILVLSKRTGSESP